MPGINNAIDVYLSENNMVILMADTSVWVSGADITRIKGWGDLDLKDKARVYEENGVTTYTKYPMPMLAPTEPSYDGEGNLLGTKPTEYVDHVVYTGLGTNQAILMTEELTLPDEGVIALPKRPATPDADAGQAAWATYEAEMKVYEAAMRQYLEATNYSKHLYMLGKNVDGVLGTLLATDEEISKNAPTLGTTGVYVNLPMEYDYFQKAEYNRLVELAQSAYEAVIRYTSRYNPEWLSMKTRFDAYYTEFYNQLLNDGKHEKTAPTRSEVLNAMWNATRVGRNATPEEQAKAADIQEVYQYITTNPDWIENALEDTVGEIVSAYQTYAVTRAQMEAGQDEMNAYNKEHKAWLALIDEIQKYEENGVNIYKNYEGLLNALTAAEAARDAADDAQVKAQNAHTSATNQLTNATTYKDNLLEEKKTMEENAAAAGTLNDPDYLANMREMEKEAQLAERLEQDAKNLINGDYYRYVTDKDGKIVYATTSNVDTDAESGDYLVYKSDGTLMDKTDYIIDSGDLLYIEGNPIPLVKKEAEYYVAKGTRELLQEANDEQLLRQGEYDVAFNNSQNSDQYKAFKRLLQVIQVEADDSLIGYPYAVKRNADGSLVVDANGLYERESTVSRWTGPRNYVYYEDDALEPTTISVDFSELELQNMQLEQYSTLVAHKDLAASNLKSSKDRVLLMQGKLNNLAIELEYATQYLKYQEEVSRMKVTFTVTGPNLPSSGVTGSIEALPKPDDYELTIYKEYTDEVLVPGTKIDYTLSDDNNGINTGRHSDDFYNIYAKAVNDYATFNWLAMVGVEDAVHKVDMAVYGEQLRALADSLADGAKTVSKWASGDLYNAYMSMRKVSSEKTAADFLGTGKTGELDRYLTGLTFQNTTIVNEIVSVYAGAMYTGAITEDGYIYLWGTNGTTSGKGSILGNQETTGVSAVPGLVYKKEIGTEYINQIVRLGSNSGSAINRHMLATRIPAPPWPGAATPRASWVTVPPLPPTCLWWWAAATCPSSLPLL